MKGKKIIGFALVIVVGIINVILFQAWRKNDEQEAIELVSKNSNYLSVGLSERQAVTVPGIAKGKERNSSTVVKDKPRKKATKEYIIPVLLLSCNRPSAVTRSLEQLLALRPSEKQFPIIVSQDCGDRQTTKAIAAHGKQIKFIKQPDLSKISARECSHPVAQGYCRISRHYKWALTQIFDVMNYNSCIILEDDLDIAPDFFDYFKATRSLLDSDPSIFCISAWNDNGKEGMVKDNSLLYRSDFFPGLGWMMKRSFWEVLKPKWPSVYWDDWLRNPSQRRGRVCIRPEISRTRTFGEIGVSRGQFFNEYLKYIQLNKNPYNFTQQDLSYLHKGNYDRDFFQKIQSLPVVTLNNLSSGSSEVKLHYSSEQEFIGLARHFGIMKDFKAGVPRTGYRGVVSFVSNGVRIHLTPRK